MAEYRLTDTDAVIRVGVDAQIPHDNDAYIPNDPANRDRAAYNVWLAAGGVPDPYVAPPPMLPVVDANTRLDAGINAALVAAQDVRDSLHDIPLQLSGANFQQFLLQAKILSDAFVAMLQAQQQPPAE
jgi:hypothetical protein